MTPIIPIIFTWYYHRHEKRKQQFEVLRKLGGSRYALTENTTQEVKVQFFSALNEVVILYHEHPDVIKALQNMHRELKISDRLHDNLVTLFKAMCKVLKISNNGLNDEFFLRPFSSTTGFNLFHFKSSDN